MSIHHAEFLHLWRRISLGSDGIEFQGPDNAHPGRCIVYPLRVLGTQNEGDVSDRFWGFKFMILESFEGREIHHVHF